MAAPKRRTAPQPDGQVVRTIEAASIAPLPPGLVDIRMIGAFLTMSVTKVEALVRQGLPYVDVGEHDPRCRVKRCLRFHPPSVLAWILRERGRNGPGGVAQ